MTQALEGLSVDEAVLLRRSAAKLARQFQGIVNPETVERLLLESYDGLRGGRVKTWLPVLAERFAADRLRALAKTEGTLTNDKPHVLFLCVHNAGRSQMAAGWLQHLGGDAVEVFSGGSTPASETNAAAVAAMDEVGIDISSSYPKPWTDEIVEAADVVVTMGCGDACPVVPGTRYLDWELSDPKGLDVAAVRPIRDDIERRVRDLMGELGIPAQR